MKIYIVRHGETLANKKGVLQGTLDTPLSELGLDLAHKTGVGLKDVHFDICFTSPLNRALNTAKIILEENNYKDTKLVEEDAIKEMNMGDWEGLPFKGDTTIPLDQSEMFFTNPFNLKPIPNGETTKAVCERTQKFLFDLVKENKYENVLISTHGFATRAILNFMYENKEDFWQGHVPYNCAVNIIEYKDDEFKFIAQDKIFYDKDQIFDHYSIK